MPEAGLEAAKEALRNFLDGDDHRPGVVPWDLENGVEPPPGMELHYRADDRILWAYLRDYGVRVRYRWDGFRWVEEESDATPEDTAQALATLIQEVRRLEDRIARLEHLLKGCLEGRG